MVYNKTKKTSGIYPIASVCTPLYTCVSSVYLYNYTFSLTTDHNNSLREIKVRSVWSQYKCYKLSIHCLSSLFKIIHAYIYSMHKSQSFGVHAKGIAATGGGVH